MNNIEQSQPTGDNDLDEIYLIIVTTKYGQEIFDFLIVSEALDKMISLIKESPVYTLDKKLLRIDLIKKSENSELNIQSHLFY